MSSKERRLKALANFVTAYEKENGEISPEEIRGATRRTRAKTVAVRGLSEGKGASRRKKTR
jgi:hypothetical protein